MSGMKQRLGILGGLLTALVLAAMTAPPSPTQATAYPLTITDDLGREVTIVAAPQRIVSLAPSNTEILFELDLEDQIVAVTDYCDYPEEALGKDTIGGPWSPSVEDIIALEPDFILAASINPTDTITALEGLGLTVFGIEATDMEDLLDDIETVGRITDREAQANSLTRQMQYKLDKVTDRTGELSSAEKPGVFHIMWHDPIYTSGQDTFIYDLMEKAGGENVFSDLTGYSTVDVETLLARNPEVVIVTAMGGEGSGTWSWVNTEPRLEELSARQNGRIYFVESNWLERPGPRTTYGLIQLTKCLHPDIFEDSERLYYIVGEIFGKESHFRISAEGEVEKKIEISSQGGDLTVTIAKGTMTEDDDGDPLDTLQITADDNPPAPPNDAGIIGLAYELGPSGASFDPAITISFSYDPDEIPAGVDEEELTLAYYDEDDDRWVELDSTVDTEAHTVTASVEHFTTFTVIGNEAESEEEAEIEAEPEPEAEPAPTSTSTVPPAASATSTDTTGQAQEIEPSMPPPLPPAPAPAERSNRTLIIGITAGAAAVAVSLVLRRRREM